MGISKVNVFIQFAKEEQLVGQLVLDGKELLFKYSDHYLRTGHNLSPIKLRFDNSIQTGPKNTAFKGLVGVFADSLPDAWGKLIMKRHLSHHGIATESLNTLDQLTYVNSNGLGALKYRPSVDEETESSPINLDQFEGHIQEIFSGESTEVVDYLFLQGGSPGGARPKVYAGYNPTTDELITDHSELPHDFEHWIVKFAASVDHPDIANIEMAYWHMAKDAGLDVSTSKLFKGDSGKHYFGTKRFDRIGNNRIHMISAAGYFHDDYEHSQLDYGHLINQGSELFNHAKVTEQIFRRAVFNVFAHNRDDHSKNFAFLMNEIGEWSFSPAYDLTFSSSSQGMHSTSCSKNYVNPGTRDLMELAEHFSINSGLQIIKEIKDVISAWGSYAEKTAVTKLSKDVINEELTRILRH